MRTSRFQLYISFLGQRSTDNGQGPLMMSLAMSLAITLVSQLAAANAVQVRYDVVEGAVRVVSGEQHSALELPAVAEAIHDAGDRLYVALGYAGVAIYDTTTRATPRLVREVPAPYGQVTGLHLAAGQVWMEIAQTTAMPLWGGSGVRMPLPPVMTVQLGKAIQIVSISPTSVELDVGSSNGVAVGDHFSIFKQTMVEGTFFGRELAAVVTVTAVKEDCCLARLGRGMRVAPEDHVQPARQDERASNVFPSRLDGFMELSASLRPLIKVGTPFGLGILADANLTYVGRGWFAGLRLQPLGLGWTKKGNVVSTSLAAEGGYDHSAFAVGLGLGVSTINGDLDFLLSDRYGRLAVLALAAEDATNTIPAYSQRNRTALVLTQQVRLGARDGLHLDIHNIFLFHDDPVEEEMGVVYGGSNGKMVFPVTPYTNIFLEGGGGPMGYAFGAIGMFSWLTGSGDIGSLGLSVSAGGAGVWGSVEVEETVSEKIVKYRQEVSIAGPMVSIGLVYRFLPW